MADKEDPPPFGQFKPADQPAAAVAQRISSETRLDSITVDLLTSSNSFLIQQRVRWVEAITQGCCEQANIYDVFEKETKQKLFVSIQ